MKKWLPLCTVIFTLCKFIFITSVYAQNAVISGFVRDQFGNLPGVKIQVSGETTHTKSQLDGFFSISVEPGSVSLVAKYLLYKDTIIPLQLNPYDTISINIFLEPISSVDQGSSLSSRSKSKNSIESSVPVTIITSEQIEMSGQTELGQILHFLCPAFNSTRQTISDGTDHVDPATLRGYGPDQVLILINGKRYHSSALLNVNGTIGRGSVGTDINSIPVSAVERIEILTDGAAAIYGSDAIAGVINLVLNQETGILVFQNRLGINSVGDGLTSFSGVNVGFEVGKSGFINISGEYRDRKATNRAGDYTGNVFYTDDDLDKKKIIETDFFENTGIEGQKVMEIGNSATRNLALFFNSQIELSHKSYFYAFGGRNFREGKSRGFYRFPVNKDRIVSDIYPLGFSPQIVSGIIDNTLTFGVNGKTKNWTTDISTTFGSNELDFTVQNSNNASLGISSPTVFYAGGFLYKQNTSNLDFSRDYDFFSGTTVSFGGEIRLENYQIFHGEVASYSDGEKFIIENGDTIFGQAGAQVFPGFQPANELDKFRTNQSLYIDVESNIDSKLLLRGSARYETFNDFKGKIIWKLGARYKVSENLAFRVGAATGFRAPSLHQIYFNNISSQFIGTESYEVGTFNNISRVSEAFEISRLKPEISNHFTLGLTGKIDKNLDFNMEFYNSKVYDRIVLSGLFSSGYEDILNPLNVAAAQFLINAIDIATNGSELNVNHQMKLGKGVLKSRLASAFIVNKITRFNYSKNDTINIDDELLFNREEQSRIKNAQPMFKTMLNLSYELRKVHFGINTTYFERVKYVHPLDGDQTNWVLNTYSGIIETRDQVFKAKIVTDVFADLKIATNIRVSLKINNLFNIYPDSHKHSENTGNGNFIYSRRVQQFGVNGLNLFAGITMLM